MEKNIPSGYIEIKKATIIVLAYNNYWHLKECITSIRTQKYRDVEIILADDCSKEIDKQRIIDEIEQLIAGKYPVRFLFNERNLGTVKNFNNAIANAAGELIIPLSMDDCFPDDYVLDQIVSYFNKNKILLATSYSCYVRGNDIAIGPSKAEVKLYEDSLKTNIQLLTEGLFIKGANTYYHRDIFNVLGQFDETFRLYEDVPFLFRYLDAGYKLNVVPYICILYNKDACGVSDKKNPNVLLLADRVRLYDRILNMKKYKKAFRWIRYNRFRNATPNRRWISTFLFPDIIILKIFRKGLQKNIWHKCSNEDERRNKIRNFDSSINLSFPQILD